MALKEREKETSGKYLIWSGRHLTNLENPSFRYRGGVIRHESWNGIDLLRNGGGGSGISFSNIVDGKENLLGVLVFEGDGKIHLKGTDNKVLCEISVNERKIYDRKTGTLKDILVPGDPVMAEQVVVKNGEKALTIRPGADQIDFASAGGKWRIQSHYSEALQCQAFALYDLDADYDGSGRYQEMLHLSQKTRTIFNHKRNKTAGIVVDDDLRFWPGDVWNPASDIPFAGYLTTDGTQIYFTIPLHKKCQDRTITLNGRLTVRGTEGYILNMADISEFKITTNGYENLLRVIVEKPDKSVFSELNNIAVAVSLNHNPSIVFS